MNYDKMLEYVEKTLTDANKLQPSNPKHHFRNRFTHTKRVLGWCKRLEDDLECDKKILYTAAIFHDIGYVGGGNGHALRSELMFRKYASDHSFDEDFTESVAKIIGLHSSKHLLGQEDLPNECVILMEADLLDEEGALGFVWDFMAIANDPGVSYYDSIEAADHSAHILEQDYMVTPKAKEYWEKKKSLVKEFIDELKSDLFIEE